MLQIREHAQFTAPSRHRVQNGAGNQGEEGHTDVPIDKTAVGDWVSEAPGALRR